MSSGNFAAVKLKEKTSTVQFFIIFLCGLIPGMSVGLKGGTGGYGSFVWCKCDGKKMRSARHRSLRGGIDSRSDLTYMRNMGVNVLIMSAQKSSVPVARLKLLEPESAVSFSSAPVLLWQDCDYQGSDSVSSSHRWLRGINNWSA